ncbi:MAG: phospholipase D family protein [Candidatus Atabeyarchaeum deiterrae]
MAVKVLGSDLWSTITSLSRHSTRRYVAVAYLGQGANRLLPLGKGDCLVVNMSESTVRGGQTNPSEIEKYLAKGVNVFTCLNLHAKAFVFDRMAIVSSANVSQHSKHELIEMGLLCRDRDVVSRVRGWIKSLQRDPVSPEYVKRCKRLYRPPRMHNTSSKGRGTALPSYSTVWLLGSLRLYELTEEEKCICKRDVGNASRRIQNSGRYHVEVVRQPMESHFSQRVAPGDQVIQVVSDKNRIRVYPPSRVLAITRLKAPNEQKLRNVFVHLEEPNHFRPIGWNYFKKKLAKVGLRRITENSRLEVETLEAKSVVLGLWS